MRITGEAENLQKRVGDILKLNFFVMKKMLLPMLALVGALSLSAFSSRTISGKQWHFKTSMTLEDAREPSAYESSFGTVSCGGSELPCIIEVPHINGNSDQQDLQAYLNSFSTDQAVVDAAVSQQD
jgi:hypothetical protein